MLLPKLKRWREAAKALMGEHGIPGNVLLLEADLLGVSVEEIG